ncbi:MAG: L-threonylcarbamoyladenylate synthase [Acidimicrobiia bacterium]
MHRATDDRAIDDAVATLRAGELVAIPTETVYGLAADASSDQAVAKIFATKGRPTGHPLIVHIASVDELSRWAATPIPETAMQLGRAFWPGPLTIIVRRSSLVSAAVTGGRDTVGIRVPDHPLTLELLRRFDGGVAAPSANRFGRVSPTTAHDVEAEFDGHVLVLDGGPCRVGVESTIVDTTVEPIVVLRPGAVTAEQIEAVLGRPVERTAQGPSRAPGMLASHYAPNATVELVDAATLEPRAEALRADGTRVVTIHPHVAVEEYARSLYGWLRAADRDGADVVLAVPPADEGLGAAVCDRLRKAAGPRS